MGAAQASVDRVAISRAIRKLGYLSVTRRLVTPPIKPRTAARLSWRSHLEVFADRAAIEQDFHDVKEVEGAGQQQVRHLWANVGAWHLNLWMHTLVELWAWNQPKKQICDRSASPWDDVDRRPSHADRGKALRRWMLREEYLALARPWQLPRKITAVVQKLLNLAG